MQGQSHLRCTVFSYSCETSVLLLCPDRDSLPPDSRNHIYMRSKIEGCSLLMIICAISSWNILCIKGGNVTFMFEQCQLCGIWLQMSDISIWTKNVQLTNINNLRMYFYAPNKKTSALLCAQDSTPMFAFTSENHSAVQLDSVRRKAARQLWTLHCWAVISPISDR